MIFFLLIFDYEQLNSGKYLRLKVFSFGVKSVRMDYFQNVLNYIVRSVFPSVYTSRLNLL